jgi:transcriptional regulator with XRE-family HTH domain
MPEAEAYAGPRMALRKSGTGETPTLIGQRILKALNGRTRAWLSAQTGYSQTTISAWIWGRYMPSAERARRVAQVLGVTYEALVKDVPLSAVGGGPPNRLDKSGSTPQTGYGTRHDSASPSEELPTMPHDRYTRLLAVELDYLTPAESELLWNDLQEYRAAIRVQAGRAVPRTRPPRRHR